ncbi:MAG: hypothetical protein ACI4IM_03230 [Acutalibacteraceae bacterium]
MKRFTKIITACLLTASVALTVGCSSEKEPETTGTTSTTTSQLQRATMANDSSLSQLRNTVEAEDCKVGVAFIGYLNEHLTKGEILDFIKESACGKKYDFLCETSAQNIVDAYGYELFTIVPKSEKGTVTIYEAEMTEDGEYRDLRDRVLYKGKPGEPVILKCNISEVYSNVLVVSVENNEITEFRPILSMRDGRLASAQGCYDFSVYDNKYEAELNARERLCQTDEIQYYLSKDMTLVYMDEIREVNGYDCMIFAVGTENGDQFVREQLYAVSDDQIFFYNVQNDGWQVLGLG